MWIAPSLGALVSFPQGPNKVKDAKSRTKMSRGFSIAPIKAVLCANDVLTSLGSIIISSSRSSSSSSSSSLGSFNNGHTRKKIHKIGRKYLIIYFSY